MFNVLFNQFVHMFIMEIAWQVMPQTTVGIDKSTPRNLVD